MEIHRNKDKEFNYYKIYVRNERGWFKYNVVSSKDAKDSALRHLDELAENYEISEYMTIVYNKELNMDDVCDLKTFGIYNKRKEK